MATVFYKLVCQVCGNNFSGRFCRRKKTCSKQCRYLLSGKGISLARKANPVGYWLGKKRLDMMGEKNPFYGKRHSPETIKRFIQRIASLLNPPNWQGGKSSFYHIMNGRQEWKDWRKEVFERDGYKCLDCGEGGYLEPHHILPIRKEGYRARLFDLKNGITLCRQCHQKTFWKEEELAKSYFALIPA